MSSTPAQPEPVVAVDWMKIRSKAGPYPLVAFEFVREGLAYTVDRMHGQARLGRTDATLVAEDRHITGQQLCIGLRDFAIRQYGLLAPSVLASWHVRRTDDFGRIVFAMIAGNVMRKTPQDSIEDFRCVYDFDEAFSADQLLAGIGLSGVAERDSRDGATA